MLHLHFPTTLIETDALYILANYLLFTLEWPMGKNHRHSGVRDR